MKHLWIILVIILSLCLLAMPLAAQETTETQLPMQPTESPLDGMLVFDKTIGTLIVLVVGTLLIGLGAAVYKSIPPAAQKAMLEAGKPAAELAKMIIEAGIKRTPTKLDDEWWNGVMALVKENAELRDFLKAKFQELFGGQVVAESVIQAANAVYGGPTVKVPIVDTIPSGG